MITYNQALEFLNQVFDVNAGKPISWDIAYYEMTVFLDTNDLDADAQALIEETINGLLLTNGPP
jgi:hypothetical protein